MRNIAPRNNKKYPMHIKIGIASIVADTSYLVIPLSFSVLIFLVLNQDEYPGV